jgi:hypothetical protein
MSVQLALRFDEVPITCETQQRVPLIFLAFAPYFCRLPMDIPMDKGYPLWHVQRKK